MGYFKVTFVAIGIELREKLKYGFGSLTTHGYIKST